MGNRKFPEHFPKGMVELIPAWGGNWFRNGVAHEAGWEMGLIDPRTPAMDYFLYWDWAMDPKSPFYGEGDPFHDGNCTFPPPPPQPARHKRQRNYHFRRRSPSRSSEPLQSRSKPYERAPRHRTGSVPNVDIPWTARATAMYGMYSSPALNERSRLNASSSYCDNGEGSHTFASSSTAGTFGDHQCPPTDLSFTPLYGASTPEVTAMQLNSTLNADRLMQYRAPNATHTVQGPWGMQQFDGAGVRAGHDARIVAFPDTVPGVFGEGSLTPPDISMSGGIHHLDISGCGTGGSKLPQFPPNHTPQRSAGNPPPHHIHSNPDFNSGHFGSRPGGMMARPDTQPQLSILPSRWNLGIYPHSNHPSTGACSNISLPENEEPRTPEYGPPNDFGSGGPYDFRSN